MDFSIASILALDGVTNGAVYALLALATCRDLAARAVACSTPQEVRALVPMDEN